MDPNETLDKRRGGVFKHGDIHTWRMTCDIHSDRLQGEKHSSGTVNLANSLISAFPFSEPSNHKFLFCNLPGLWPFIATAPESI